MIIGRLIGLARAADGLDHMLTEETDAVTLAGLRADDDALAERITAEKRRLAPDCFTCAVQCGRTADYDMAELQNEPEADVKRAKEALLALLKKRANEEQPPIRAFYRALRAVGDGFEAGFLDREYRILEEA